MANATSNKDGIFSAAQSAAQILYTVTSATHLYSGVPIAVAVSTGLAVACDDTSGNRFVGVSLVEVNNPSGGSLQIPVDPHPGFIVLNAATNSGTWVGNLVYFLDDQTAVLTASSTNKVLAGRCAQVLGSASATGKILVDTRPALAWNGSTSGS